MAIGDVVFVEQFYADVQEKVHNLETDTIKVGLVTDSTTPAADTSDPRWGAGGSTDWSTNEVTPGGNYSSGGAAAANPTVTLTAGEGVFDADDVSISQDASNPTDARWGIIYNDTASGKNVIGYVDLGGDVDLSGGDFSISWNASGISTMGAAA